MKKEKNDDKTLEWQAPELVRLKDNERSQGVCTFGSTDANCTDGSVASVTCDIGSTGNLP
ncbi:MAG: hypothetical protein A2987_01430 [Omnitrophica bacterium RIFCSPLOWO2_01_FULL_45_10]|nr:MAG: hypothetical protein A2987_01430 [Omnitrophica bacterium RIFCSPLOWO2_01_FULL_45_10]